MTQERDQILSRHHAALLALFDSMVSSGNAAIKLLASTNGAAVIAMLAFAGGIAGKEKPILASTAPILASLQMFGWGLMLSVVAAGTAYLAQVLYAVGSGALDKTVEPPYLRRNGRYYVFIFCGSVVHVGTVALCISSFVFFAMGVRSVSKLVGAIQL